MSNIINLATTIKGKDFGGVVDNDPMWSLSVFKGDLIDVVTIDTGSDDYKCEIHLTNWYTGKVYALDRVIIGRIETLEDEETGETFDYYINSTNRAERLLEKMKEKGTIDLSHWVDITNDPAYK